MHESAWATFGRFHVIVIHFPIALLLVALVVDLFRRRSREMAPGAAATICLVLGAIGAVIASVMGWSDADRLDYHGAEAKLVFVHRWVGIGASVGAVAAAYMALRLRNTLNFGLDVAYRIVLVASAVAVSVAGHYGGMLVHGEDYLKPEVQEQPAAPVKPEQKKEAPPPATSSAVDFHRDIEPIFADNCVECHRPEKTKGKLRLDTKALAMAGGANGPCIIPGKSAESLLIQRVLGEGGDPQMPKNKAPLSEEQIALLKKWIDEGANWPEN